MEVSKGHTRRKTLEKVKEIRRINQIQRETAKSKGRKKNDTKSNT
jgi:hypothetical protein